MKVILLFLIFLNVSCGHYQFGHMNRALPGGYDRVSVPVFVNNTSEVGIESFFTQDLRTEFERSRLAIVASKIDAQVIIEGTVDKVQFIPGVPINNQSGELSVPQNRALLNPPGSATRYATNPLPANTILYKQFTATVSVKIVARKVSDNSVLWQGTFDGSRVYQAPLVGDPRGGLNSIDAIYNQSSRNLTVAEIAKDLMSEAHDRITENF